MGNRKIDGSELKVRGYVLDNSSDIYQAIEREFVRIRLPGMLERYEAGNSIAFGELSVNKLLSLDMSYPKVSQSRTSQDGVPVAVRQKTTFRTDYSYQQ